jgi:aldehyde dehydrogenase (NAD+)
VVNLITASTPGPAEALVASPDVDMVSFTGSTRAGIEVARAAAPTVKRVAQELGGKSPNIILDDDSFAANVAGGVSAVMLNSGQTCTAPTRMLVPSGRMDEAIEAVRALEPTLVVGDPTGEVRLGPVVSEAQFDKIQTLIQSGLESGATLVIGGAGRPDGLPVGYYVKPTVFANVTNDMEIARTEIFGPVLVILGYSDLDEAIDIANDTDYGLAGYVAGEDLDTVRKVASRIRAGQIGINGAPPDTSSPFGGYKQSGNGREWGDYAFNEFLEVKTLLGFGA